jgi:carotenoid cleavage dioxygenase-like enzyme
MSTSLDSTRVSTENPWCEGNYLPVDSEVTAFDLPVTGKIPEELEGRFLRNGPNPMQESDPAKHHWFVGTGMMHGVRLRAGRAEWYRNRWVRSPAVSAGLREPKRPGSPGLDVPWLPPGEIGPNTHIIGHAGRTLALVEAGLASPYELTYELSTVGPCDFEGTLPEGYTAHTKRDPKTGVLHGVSYDATWGPQVQYTQVSAAGRVERLVNIPVNGPVMMHDLAITEHHVVFFDLPVQFSSQEAGGGSERPYIWDSTYQARLGVMPKNGEAADPDLGSAGAQSAVTIGSQALPLTGVVDELELNVRARPAVPKWHQNSIPLPRPGGQALAVPRPQSLCPGDHDHLDPIQ